MCAASVGAPPAGSLVIENTTFSPFCATGSGANGLGGGPLQNRPPHALASPCVATRVGAGEREQDGHRRQGRLAGIVFVSHGELRSRAVCRQG